MNPRFTRFLACAFAGWFVLFWICYLIPGGVPEVMGYRRVLPFPGWNDQAFSSAWFQKVSAWAVDHSPFRYQAIITRNRVLFTAARHLPALPINPGNLRVASGHHDFLFLLEDSPGYRSQRAVEEIADHAVNFARRIQATGRRVFFVPMPDKSSVYPEETGLVFRWLDARSRRRALPEAFAAKFAKAPEVRDAYIPLWEPLQAAKKSSPDLLYWKHCSHWNTRGYLVGIEQILNHLQPGVFDASQLARRERADVYQGDLTSRMLFLPDFEVGPTVVAHLSTDHPRVPGRVLFIGDSFCYIYYSQLLTPWFEDVDYVSPERTAELIPKITPSDAIVLAIVERSLEGRLQFLGSDAFLDTVPPRQKK